MPKQFKSLAVIAGGVASILLTPTLVHSESLGAGQAGRAAEPTDYQYATPPTPRRNIEIAPLAERPLGVDEGPQLQVDAFKLVGFDIPDGIDLTMNEVLELIEGERTSRNGVFTVGQLQKLADQLTNLYRERGMILAHAFIPQQKVEDGTVRIEIMQGVLGSVVFEGEAEEALIYNDQVLQLPFEDLMGQSVTVGSVEQALFSLVDYPGIGFFGIFRPGREVGDTELLVKVDKQPEHVFSVGLDNHGSEQTGEYRMYADATWNSPTGYADRLYAKIQHSLSPAQALYGEVDYLLPKFHADLDFGIRLSRNDYEVEETVRQQGIVEDASINAAWKAIRGRTLNLTVGAELEKRHYETEGDLGDNFDDLTILKLAGSYDHTDTWLAGLLGDDATAISQGTLRYSHGFADLLGAMEAENDTNSSRVGKGGIHAGAEFDKLEFAFLRYQNLTRSQSLMFRLQGQWSPDMLVSIEQYSLGGPTSVRAYPAAQYLADTAFTTSLEYQFEFPGSQDSEAFWGHKWGEILRVIVFADYGWGELNDPLGSELDKLELAGAGLGLRLNIPDRLTAAVTVAAPLAEADPANDRDPQYFFNLRYTF